MFRSQGKTYPEIILGLAEVLGDELTPEQIKWVEKEKSDILEIINHKKKVGAARYSQQQLEQKYKSYEFGFCYGDNKTPHFQQFSDYIHDKYNYFATEDHDYWYRDNYYTMIGSTEFDALIERESKGKHKPANFKHFRSKSRARHFKEASAFNPAGYINLQNGILDVKESKVIPHSPNFLFNYRLDHKYDPTADCPNFKKWLLDQTEDEDAVKLVFEYLGYIIEGKGQYKQKVLIATGERDTGKSTLCKIFQLFLGDKNVSAVDLDQLDDRFKPITMIGKLANISDEIPDKGINAQVFKKIVGGGRVTLEQKNKPAFEAQINAKLMASANGFVKFDSSRHAEALMKRLMYVNFLKVIPLEEKIDDLEYSFVTEFPGMLNEAIKGLQRLKSQNRFTIPEKSKEALEKAHRQSDSVLMYLEEYVILNFKTTNGPVELKHMYHEYVLVCKDDNLRPVSKNEFFDRVKRYETHLVNRLVDAEHPTNLEVTQVSLLTKPKNIWSMRYVDNYRRTSSLVSLANNLG